MTRHVVAAVGEIAPGGCKIVTLQGREVGVFFVNGEYFALFNRCPHEGAPLCLGRLFAAMESERPGEYRLARDGEMLRCPWHGWEYDIRTGQSWCEPEGVRARTYDVVVEQGATLGKGPFVAETFPVEVERDYVVVTL